MMYHLEESPGGSPSLTVVPQESTPHRTELSYMVRLYRHLNNAVC